MTLPRTASPHDAATAGRVCPLDYHYSPAVFDRNAELHAEVLYVIGGLYGNLAALRASEALAQQEDGATTLVFNGDFHALDAEPEWFAEVERRVGAHRSIRGNVETEIARADDIGAGCGCAYPASVSDELVRCSNAIIAQLRGVANSLPAVAERLRRLPMHLVAQVGALRIGILHGDAGALAGWRFAAEALDDPSNADFLAGLPGQSRIDVFASTHTGLSVLRDFWLSGARLTIINNGAAGLPNFAGSHYGVISRIGSRRSPHPPLYGLERDGVYIDALAVPYDARAFRQQFLARWPEGSAGYRAYFARIENGPAHHLARARPAATKASN